MSVNEMNLSIAVKGKSLLSIKTLGLLGVIGAPMLLVETLLRMANVLPQTGDNAWVGVLEILYIGGWMATEVGMRRLRVTGDGTGAKILFIVQTFGLMMAFLFGVQVLFGASYDNPNSTLLFKITDIFYPLSHLLMLVVGVFVWRAQVWCGWLRIAPFPVGIVLALFMAGLGALIDLPQGALIFAASTATGLFSLAFGIYRNAAKNVSAHF